METDMNDKAVDMKNEIRSIANLQALIISKRYISVALIAAAFYLSAMGEAVSSLYILLFLNLLPPILSYSFKNTTWRNKWLQALIKEEPFRLNNLKIKYKYSRINYISNSIAYLFTMLLIFLWQINYSNNEVSNYILSRLPLLILATSITLRFLAVVLYRIKLPYDLLHNRV